MAESPGQELRKTNHSNLESIHFIEAGRFVPDHSSRQRELSAFSTRDDVAMAILKREKMAFLNKIGMGAAVTNSTKMEFPRKYGALELDRLIVKPGGAFPLAYFNLLSGAVAYSGKLSLVAEFVDENVGVRAMEEIGDLALAWLLDGWRSWGNRRQFKSLPPRLESLALVAQWIERLVADQKVADSSSAEGT